MGSTIEVGKEQQFQELDVGSVHGLTLVKYVSPPLLSCIHLLNFSRDSIAQKANQGNYFLQPFFSNTEGLQGFEYLTNYTVLHACVLQLLSDD